jgi:hypothetical protein
MTIIIKNLKIILLVLILNVLYFNTSAQINNIGENFRVEEKSIPSLQIKNNKFNYVVDSVINYVWKKKAIKTGKKYRLSLTYIANEEVEIVISLLLSENDLFNNVPDGILMYKENIFYVFEEDKNLIKKFFRKKCKNVKMNFHANNNKNYLWSYNVDTIDWYFVYKDKNFYCTAINIYDF